MGIHSQPYPFDDVSESRKQTPTSLKAINVIIGAGDPVSNLPVVVDFEHHQVHEGETYSSEDVQSGLGTSTIKYAFTVATYADTIQCPHLIVNADCYADTGAGGALIQIYEGATYTNGTPMNMYNRNRNSANVPKAGTSVYTGVTSTNGTLIHSFYSVVGGESRGAVERVMKSNTTYRIDVIGQKIGTGAVIAFNWYEDVGV